MKARAFFLAALGAGLMLSSSAQAYNLLPGPVRWPPDQNGIATIQYYIDPTPPSGWTQQEAEASIQLAWNAWTSLDCSTLQTTYLGPGSDPMRGFIEDGNSMVSFNDPGGVIDSVGALAANVRWQTGPKVDVNGIQWIPITETDTVYGNWPWASTVDIQGGCGGAYNLEETGVHELGHGLGWAHSCEGGEPCTEEEADAVMYWVSDTCEERPYPRLDDERMFDLSYGANLLSTFTADVTSGGPLPLPVTFAVDTFADATNLAAVWDFGDGGSSTEVSPTHDYDTQGLYTVSMQLSGTSPSCNGGTFTHTQVEKDYVVACDPALATFTYSVNGKSVQFTGETNSQGIGCVNNLNWDFGDGSEAHSRSPVHSYAKDGTYEVKFFADGPAGDGPIDLQTIKIQTDTGCGCVLAAPARRAATPSVLALLVLAGSALIARRRRP